MIAFAVRCLQVLRSDEHADLDCPLWDVPPVGGCMIAVIVTVQCIQAFEMADIHGNKVLCNHE